MRDEGAAVRIELEPEHQADAAHAVEQMVMVRNQLFERAAQPLARRLDLVEKAVFEYDVEHRLSGGARERVAAIGRSVGADDHAPRRLFGGEDRKSTRLNSSH